MAKDTKNKVVYRKLDELTPLEDNPRWIKEEDFNRLCASVQNNPELFEAQPIILSDRTGKLVIIAGNQRFRASKEVGLKEVPTILLSGLTEEKEREIIIRTNVTNGQWDWDMLGNNWNVGELADWGVNVSFLTEEESEMPTDEIVETPKEPKDISDEITTEFKIEIDCKDEEMQQSLYERLTEEGYECRILTL